MKDYLRQFKQARRVGVPIIAWNTADKHATSKTITANSTGPVAEWDIVRGIRALNDLARVMVTDGEAEGNPVEMAVIAASQKYSPQNGADGICLIVHNAQLFLNIPAMIQGLENLRDKYKADGQTIVLLGHRVPVPPELANDALVIDEPLPAEDELGSIVCEQLEAAKIDRNDDEVRSAANAITGMSAFAAEQALAMSMEKGKGGYSLSKEHLWERKRKTIEATKGLSVWRGGETFADIGGVEAAKAYMTLVINGRMKPNGIVFIDEIEKAMAGSGAGGDSTGASQDQLGVTLEVMQDTKAQGLLFVGHPGSAKSMLAKATGATAGVPTIKMDYGAMKGSLLGQSEEAIRQAMKVIEAVTDGKALYIATCNKLDSLPPELRRRFTLGTFFFDLPTKEERDVIWTIYRRKYDLPAGKGKNSRKDIQDEGWTGADIANCCLRAWSFNIPLKEAARFATPMCQTSPLAIEALRKTAHNAFLSANSDGLYQLPTPQTTQSGPRKFNHE